MRRALALLPHLLRVALPLCLYQGSQFRRNFGEIPEKIPFPLVTGKRNFATFR